MYRYSIGCNTASGEVNKHLWSNLVERLKLNHTTVTLFLHFVGQVCTVIFQLTWNTGIKTERANSLTNKNKPLSHEYSQALVWFDLEFTQVQCSIFIA